MLLRDINTSPNHLTFLPHLPSIQRVLFIQRVALTGLSEASWTEENEKTLDKFILDSSIRTLVVYADPYAGLRVEYAMPSQVRPQLFKVVM